MIPHPEDCKCRKDPEAWFIDSDLHHNCFWVYLKYNERVHTLNEIATLLKMSISAITTTEQKALKKLARRADLQIYKK